eukprot:5447873-Prymnesium_polylepis.1
MSAASNRMSTASEQSPRYRGAASEGASPHSEEPASVLSRISTVLTPLSEKPENSELSDPATLVALEMERTTSVTSRLSTASAASVALGRIGYVLRTVLGLRVDRSVWGLAPLDLGICVLHEVRHEDEELLKLPAQAVDRLTDQRNRRSRQWSRSVVEAKEFEDDADALAQHGVGNMPLFRIPRTLHKWGQKQHAVHPSWGDLFLDLIFVSTAYQMSGLCARALAPAPLRQRPCAGPPPTRAGTHTPPRRSAVRGDSVCPASDPPWRALIGQARHGLLPLRRRHGRLLPRQQQRVRRL